MYTKRNILIAIIFIVFFFVSGVFILVFFDNTVDYNEQKTKSGLKVFSMKDTSLPFIKYHVLFPRAGADYSFEGKSGLSALTAYLLDQGAGGLSSEQIQEELNQLGTELGVSLGRQTVHLSLEGLSWHKEKLFDLFKKILVSPHLKKEELEILKQQFSARRIKLLDRANFIANHLMRKSLFQGVEGEDSYGDLISLAQINLEDIKLFYKKRYKEGNPIFMLVGNFDRAFEREFYSFAEQNFVYHEEPSTAKIKSPVVKKAQFKLLSNDELIQSEVRLAYNLFPFPKEDLRSFMTMRLANFILGGGGMVSRLFLELREERGLTYGVYSFLNLGKVYGFFDISGATKNSSVKEFLEQALLNLKKIKEEGVSLEELDRVKQSFKMKYLKNIETPEDKLSQIVYYNEYLGLDSEFLDNYLDTVDSISLEEVNGIFDKFVLFSETDSLSPISSGSESTAFLQVLIYGNSSIQSQLEDLPSLPPLEVISFKDYFKEELEFYKNQLSKK